MESDNILSSSRRAALGQRGFEENDVDETACLEGFNGSSERGGHHGFEMLQHETSVGATKNLFNVLEVSAVSVRISA